MKLYSIDASPFAARIRMQIAMKDLDCEILPPPHALRTPEFHARFPLGKIPVLELDEGTQIEESWAIAEYLEDAFPSPAMRPSDPAGTARCRVRARIADLHLGPAIFPLFGPALAGQTPPGLTDRVAAVSAECAKLDRWLESETSLPERSMDIGDLALVTHTFYVSAILGELGAGDPVQSHARLSAWSAAMMENRHVSAAIEALHEGFQGLISRTRQTS